MKVGRLGQLAIKDMAWTKVMKIVMEKYVAIKKVGIRGFGT